MELDVGLTGGAAIQWSSVRLVLFDAVGTLLHPQPSAGEAYYRAGRCWGSRCTRDEVHNRFAAALKQYMAGDDGQTSEDIERQRWQRIVAAVFADIPEHTEAIFQQLWHHFADLRHWRLEPQLLKLWNACLNNGLEVGLASNFDRRLQTLCAQSPELARTPHVYCSSQLGFTKPDVRFYRGIEQQTGRRGAEILMIGDDRRCDFDGPRAAGWQALLWPFEPPAA